MKEQSYLEIYNLFKETGYGLAEIERLMKIVKNNSITLQRVKVVLTAAKIKNWGIGAVYNALKENWILTHIEKKINALEKNRKKQQLSFNKLRKIQIEREVYLRKIEKAQEENRKLDIYFNSLDKNLQLEIDELAKRKWLNMVGSLGKEGAYPKICTFYPLVKEYMLKNNHYIL